MKTNQQREGRETGSNNYARMATGPPETCEMALSGLRLEYWDTGKSLDLYITICNYWGIWLC